MGDDVQPSVCDTPVYIQDCRSAPSNHGRLVWTTFNTGVELTQIVRQSESGCVDVLENLYTTRQQIHWLQQFQWLLGRMDEQGLCVTNVMVYCKPGE